MAHPFKWTFSCCCMSFHRNLRWKKRQLQTQSFRFKSSLFKIKLKFQFFNLLDDVLQDLQTKVSYNSWLGFVSQS